MALAPAVAAGAHVPEKILTKKQERLAKRLGVKRQPLTEPCVEGSETACTRRALDRTRARLAALEKEGGKLRILHLGDSHVAADYITRTVREALQKQYGEGGRGFTQIMQRWGYGGRRLRGTNGWVQDRIVDTGRAGLPFGFSGISATSSRKGAKLRFRLEPGDSEVRVYFQAQPGGGDFEVRLGDKTLATISTQADKPVSRVEAVPFPKSLEAKGKLSLLAKGSEVRLYGIAFESKSPGVIYEPIGPVGADAKVYLQLERNSLVEHLAAHRPDLVVLMVGGNDALKIRRKWTTLEKVRRDHEELLDLIHKTLPEADCLLWTPMDSGYDQDGKVVSKPFLPETRAMQLEVAKEKGCAVWDLYQVMGGEGSIAVWAKAKIMSSDLIHPKSSAADLIGALFSEAFLESMKAEK